MLVCQRLQEKQCEAFFFGGVVSVGDGSSDGIDREGRQRISGGTGSGVEEIRRHVRQQAV